MRSLDDIPVEGWRRHLPWFQPKAFRQNLDLAEAMGRVAAQKGVASASLAISWVVRQGAVALPVTTSVE